MPIEVVTEEQKQHALEYFRSQALLAPHYAIYNETLDIVEFSLDVLCEIQDTLEAEGWTIVGNDDGDTWYVPPTANPDDPRVRGLSPTQLGDWLIARIEELVPGGDELSDPVRSLVMLAEHAPFPVARPVEPAADKPA